MQFKDPFVEDELLLSLNCSANTDMTENFAEKNVILIDYARYENNS